VKTSTEEDDGDQNIVAAASSRRSATMALESATSTKDSTVVLRVMLAQLGFERMTSVTNFVTYTDL
jgi:hypothetical protein